MDTITLVYSGSQAPVSDQGPRHAVGRAGVSRKTEDLPKLGKLPTCYTQEEIGEAVGLFQQDVAKAVEAQKMEDLPKSVKLLATYTQEEIGEAVGLKQSTMADDVPVLSETEDLPKPIKLLRGRVSVTSLEPRAQVRQGPEGK